MLKLFDAELYTQYEAVQDIRLTDVERAYLDGTGRQSYSLIDNDQLESKVSEFRRRIERCDHRVLAINRSIDDLDASAFDQVCIGEQSGLFALLSSAAIVGRVGLVIVNQHRPEGNNDFTMDDAIGLMVFEIDDQSKIELIYTKFKNTLYDSWYRERISQQENVIYGVIESSFSEVLDGMLWIYSSGTTTFLDVIIKRMKSRQKGRVYLSGVNAARDRLFLVGIDYEQTGRDTLRGAKPTS